MEKKVEMKPKAERKAKVPFFARTVEGRLVVKTGVKAGARLEKPKGES